MHNNPNFFAWLIEPGTLILLAGMFGVGSVMFFVFAERWAITSSRMTWAPWMRSQTTATYRRMAYIYAVLGVGCAIGFVARYLSNT